VQWHCFCAMALCNVPWHYTMCCSIVRHAAALHGVLQHCSVCLSGVFFAAALLFVSLHCYSCCCTFVLVLWCRGIVPCAFFVSWHCGWCRGAVHGCHGAVHHAACCTWCTSLSLSRLWSFFCSIHTLKKITTINLCGIDQNMVVVVSLVMALFLVFFAC